MDRVLVELVAPREIGEHRRAAERERLLLAVGGATGRWGRPVAWLGRALIRSGAWLEATAAPRAAARPLVVTTDPCGGCAR